MKKNVILLISLFLIVAFSACNKDSDDSTDTGYTDPEFDTLKTQAIKSYSIAGYTCSANKSCGAVIYSGKLNKVSYVGFAAGRDSANANFSLKIYWNGSSIPTALDTTSPNVVIKDGTYVYNTTTDNLNITITSGNDSNSIAVYTIAFNESMTVSDGAGHSFIIDSGDTIVAYKYPE